MRIGSALGAPFGERARTGHRHERLISRGLAVDVGPQQRARQAVRAAEQLSRAVVERLEEGVVVTDADLRPISWNVSALRILGLDAGEVAASTPPFRTGQTTILERDGTTLAASESIALLAQRAGCHRADFGRRCR